MHKCIRVDRGDEVDEKKHDISLVHTVAVNKLSQTIIDH